jgi:DNA polymerase-3 subunit gamma/tau
VNVSAIHARLGQIAAAEGVAVDDDALQILASRAAGSMRDSQSLLEQLLAIGHQRISAADVNQLLGIAPAERLNGLVRHLVGRDAAAALAELDSTIASGVEVGLLLDQLVGYFRDVMTTAVGCGPDQLLYALPSQAAEVAGVGRQLGLSTVLAIGQILDQTGARLRVSMHARTLIEMAIVRICQIGELDDLAAIIAELRGTPSEQQPRKPASPEARPTGSLLASVQAQVAAKKNDEPRPVVKEVVQEVARPASVAPIATPAITAPPVVPPQITTPPTVTPPVDTSAVAEAGVDAPPVTFAASFLSALNGSGDQSVRRADPPHAAETTPTPPVEAAASDEPAEAPVERESVLEMYKMAMAGGALPKTETAPPRVSRREQLAQIAEHPFVQRAMELFDVAPDKLRYSPPGGDAN